jgi:aspartate aminotransferase
MTMKISKRAQEMTPSATIAMATKAKQMRADGIDVISFAAGEPDFDTPQAIREAAKGGIDEGLTRYPPSAGIPELRSAIREKLMRDNGLDYAEDEITVTCGAKHAIYNALQVMVDPGDEVIIPAPYWVSYPEQVKLAAATPVIAKTDPRNEFKISPADLEGAITDRTRAIILNYPSNPTGSTYSKDELRQIGEVLVGHGVAIISDEIYEKLVYDGETHCSIASACPATKPLAVIANGVSKAYAMTGWRMGFAAGPKNIIAKMSSLAGQQLTGIPGFVQKACVEAFAGPQDEVARMREEFAKRRGIMHERLMAIEGISCRMPKGAFYLFPDMSAYLGKKAGDRKIESSTDLAGYLLEKAHIATVSGDPFGAPGHIRLSYATSRDKIEEGVKRMARALSELA